MALILILYTLLNIAVFGCVVLFARAARSRSRANERIDLEDNSIIAEEWELIQRLQCVPTHCPRAVGNPPRPRKDVTCEICAALFMERYWQERLGGVAAADTNGARSGRDVAAAPMGLAEPGVSSSGAAMPDRVSLHRERRELSPRTVARGRRLYTLGFGCVVAGALVGIFSPFLVPGYLLVITGIGLLIAGAACGSL